MEDLKKEIKNLKNLNFEKQVILNYKCVEETKIKKEKIKIIENRYKSYIEIEISKSLNYEINFEFKTIYLWRNTKLLLASDIKDISFETNDNGNVNIINIW